ncbi:hypothetical protein Q5752_000148 [Cryptotrichosporon argae]
MTRDPWPPGTRPAPADALASTELRDVRLRPATVLPAQITIIHPQLRDLLVPLDRGDVLYPRGKTIERLRWAAPSKDARDGRNDDDGPAANAGSDYTTETLADLTFAPTCLTASGDLFVCGAQHGELYVQDLASGSFRLHSTMSTRAINNSISILPSWPGAWARRARERRLGYVGRGARAWDEDDGAGRYGRVRKHEWEETEERAKVRRSEEGESDDEERSSTGDDGVDDSGDDSAWAATYPNTLPFGHAPRMATSPPARALAPLPRSYRPSPSDAGPAYVTGDRLGRHAPRHTDEPRMIISSNDHSVKMMSLHTDARAPGYRDDARAPSRPTPPPLLTGPLPPRLPYFGTPFGFDSIGINEGIRANNAALLEAQMEALRSRPGQSRAASRSDSPVKLGRVGTAKFGTAVNHSSLSPDLRYMVTVGDTTDVFLHEVVKGGKEFRNVGVYSGASDSGFSTAWSKDGRKFAVASQDGQVTVWDHRSSRPLAIFYTSPAAPLPRSFVSDLTISRYSLGTDNNWVYHSQTLIDSNTGHRVVSAGSSGREPARVVKFSPEGSSRDLLVFSEENTNIHLVDARTFDAHVVVPVQCNSVLPPPRRSGVESGMAGIAGVAFDQTGDWLYAATERSVVEWDMRRHGGGEAGTWAMA